MSQTNHNPISVLGDGATDFSLTGVDDSRVSIGHTVDGKTPVYDSGFIKITSETIAGHVHPLSETLVFAYTAQGTETKAGVEYTKLDYTVYEGKGGEIGFGPQGNPLMTGVKDLQELAKGVLMDGSMHGNDRGGFSAHFVATNNATVGGNPLAFFISSEAGNIKPVGGGFDVVGGHAHIAVVPAH